MLNRVVVTRTCAVAVAASLGISGSASAKAGDRSFAQTYPVASALCARVAAGHPPRGLAASVAQVKQACSTLENGFGPLQTAVRNANVQFQTGVQNARAAIAQACQPGANRATCRQTRRSERLTIASLRRQHRAAVRLYYTSIEANRRTFWATIHSLRGGSSIKPDKPIAPQTS
jgi:hypothetical protein